MKKDFDSMSEKELLVELARQGRRTERARRLNGFLLAALLIAVVFLGTVYIPKILAPIRQISQSMSQIEQSFGEIEHVASQFDEETVGNFKDTMADINETSRQLRVMMDKFRDGGIDKLPNTLEALNETLGRFLRFFGIK